MNTNLELLNNQNSLDQNDNPSDHRDGFSLVFSNNNNGGSSSSFSSDHHHHHPSHTQFPMNFTDDDNDRDTNNIQTYSNPSENFVNLFPPPPPPVVSSFALAPNSKSLLNGRKRKRNNGRMEKPREVIHVRAKRGQATDSHSLAERVRREKINERLRCLQNLVPGCYKTMGMAVMLDVIINYVRSLQNQIEFLSMKLSAASMYYDFNSEPDAAETMQGTNGYEVQEMERILREEYGGPSHFHSTWSA